MNRQPVLVFVASDRHSDPTYDGLSVWEMLRSALWSVREIQQWPHRVEVMDVGLNEIQRDTLRAAGIRVTCVEFEPNRKAVLAPYMWKILADRMVAGDPILVADADLEFRAPGVLDELVELCRAGKFFIAHEPNTWHQAMYPVTELAGTHWHTLLWIGEEMMPALMRHKVLNAGLFGGPRALFERIVGRCRLTAALCQTIFSWYWEQLALSFECRRPEYRRRVEVLPPEYNWLTTWGANPEAKVLHFHRDLLSDLRTPVPADWLKCRFHRMPPPPAPGRDPGGNGHVVGRGGAMLGIVR